MQCIVLICLALVAGPAALPPAGPPALVAGDETPDAVELKSGKVLTGRVVYTDEQVVILRVGSRDREIERADVASVRSRIASLARLLDALDAAPPGDAATLLQLAATARDAGLEAEARLLLLWVLCLDPANEHANTELGNKAVSGGWKLEHDRSWTSTDTLLALHGKWKERWSLQTTHYTLETDLPLDQALRAAFDLERVYRALYALFATELKLLDVTERMKVQLHSGAASYPEPGSGRPGYFEPGSLTLYVLAQGAYARILVHEDTHQFLYFTTQRTKGARGQIPAWLDEGLAQYAELSLTQGAWGLALDLGRPDAQRFLFHADSKEPFDLKRMLTMDAGDFMASSDAFLKYSQAYTLVHFMLDGDDEHWRPAFFDYARRAWAGKSSMSEFKKVLDVDRDAFEEAWSDYVARMAEAFRSQ